ncbi:MAG: dimethylsulfoniopropionate demethylase [Luminiphilus sp.]
MNTPLLSLSRRLRKSPFEARSHVGARAASVYNHVVLPTTYASLEEDYWHLREHVQIWDVACQVQVQVQGPDAHRLMEFLTPRDLSSIVPGQCVYAPLIDECAGIVNDPIILCLAPDRFWLSISDTDVLLWVKGLALGGGYDVQVTDPNVFPVSIQGPKSEALLSRLIDDPLGDIRFFRFIETQIEDIPLVVARTGWSGQGGFELYLSAPSEGERLWDLIVEAGADLDLRAGCPNLIDRIETGLLSHGNDMTLNENPIEAGLDRFFKIGKSADYLGREALERIIKNGPDRRMTRLIALGDPIPNPRETYPITLDGVKNAGYVTSITYSPRLECNVGLGYVPPEAAVTGTTLLIETPAGRVKGQIANKDWQTGPD